MNALTLWEIYGNPCTHILGNVKYSKMAHRASQIAAITINVKTKTEHVH